MASKSADSSLQWAVAKLREELETARLPALKDAGVVSPDALPALESYKRTYVEGRDVHYEHPDQPAIDYYNSRTYRQMVSVEISKFVNEAVQNGDWAKIQHALGVLTKDKDNALIDYEKLRAFLAGDVGHKTYVFAGEQGGGKTYFAFYLGLFWGLIMDYQGENWLLITNSLSAAQRNDDIEYCDSVDSLLDWRFSHVGPIFFVFDEASSFATGKGRDMSDVADFGRFIRRMRKLRITSAFVGHRLLDLAPDIRNLESAVFIEKPEKERAVFYNGVPGEDDADVVLDLQNIGGHPDAFDFDTEDWTSWSWDGLDRLNDLIENPGKYEVEMNTPERNLKSTVLAITESEEKLEQMKRDRDAAIKQLAEEDEFNQTEIAEMANLSKSKVSAILSSE